MNNPELEKRARKAPSLKKGGVQRNGGPKSLEILLEKPSMSSMQPTRGAPAKQKAKQATATKQLVKSKG